MFASQGTARGKFNKAKYAEWNKLSGKILASPKTGTPVKLNKLYKAISIAAVFLLLLATGTIISLINTSSELRDIRRSETYQQIIVPMGGRSEVVLPDGSKVKLNAGSILSYNTNFGISEKIVRLEGEGYFEVEATPHVPFIVEAKDLKIEAHGTKFNVKAYPEDEEIITTLVEGVVRVMGENINLTMEPNQKVTYLMSRSGAITPVNEEIESDEVKPDASTREKITIEKSAKAQPARIQLANNVDTRKITGWKDGVFIFTSEKLSNLAVLLERRYDISIEIESEELKNFRFTGTFENETLEQVLAIIEFSAPIKYQVSKGVVNIRVDKERSHTFRELSRN